LISGRERLPLAVNFIPRNLITRKKPSNKQWDPAEQKPKIVRLTSKNLKQSLSVYTDKAGFSRALQKIRMNPPQWHNYFVSVAVGYNYKNALDEFDQKEKQFKNAHKTDRSALRHIKKEFIRIRKEYNENFRKAGFSQSEIRLLKSNLSIIKREEKLVTSTITPLLNKPKNQSQPSGGRAKTVSGSSYVVSNYTTTFPQTISPIGRVPVHRGTIGGILCDEWCFSRDIPLIDWEYTLDLPDINIPYPHVHDWWHWHSRWYGGYPHIHVHTHWLNIVPDITFRFNARMYAEICMSASGLSIVLGGQACASIGFVSACCTVEGRGIAGVSTSPNSSGNCDYGLGIDVVISCDIMGYNLVDVTIPIWGITIQGPCAVQCK